MSRTCVQRAHGEDVAQVIQRAQDELGGLVGCSLLADPLYVVQLLIRPIDIIPADGQCDRDTAGQLDQLLPERSWNGQEKESVSSFDGYHANRKQPGFSDLQKQKLIMEQQKLM